MKARRAFTLLELLTIVAIIAIMVTASIVSVRQGQSAARVRGAARDIVATIRHARSIALVSQQPSIVSYQTETIDGEVCAKVSVISTRLFSKSLVTYAETLSGQRVRVDGEDAGGDVKTREIGKEMLTDDSQGQTVQDILIGGGNKIEERGQGTIEFSPVSKDVVRGVRIKVTMGDEMLDTEVSTDQKKSMVSAWGTASGIIASYNASQTAAKDQKEEDDAMSTADADQEKMDVVWEVNGRTEPHRVWIYADGSTPDKGLSIKVDRFGAVKILGEGEDD